MESGFAMVGSLLAVGHQIKDRSGNILTEQALSRWTDDRPAASVTDVLKEWGLQT